jgi:20S proteasome alpha/beta subunit
MTLIVALRGKDGLVIAADSRGTIGDPRGLTAINDDQTKLYQLTQYCGLGVSGSSEFAAKAVDELGKVIRECSDKYAEEILTRTRDLIKNLYDDWFQKFAPQARPALSLTLVGYAKIQEQMMPRTYLLVSQSDFAPHLFPNGNCLSGVPQYAVYLMHRLYDPKMTVANLARLAVYLISETATQDPKVGGPIRIATITKTEGYKELHAADVEDIKKKNAVQSERLKKFFFGKQR